MRNKLSAFNLTLGLILSCSGFALGESGPPNDLHGPYDLSTNMLKGQMPPLQSYDRSDAIPFAGQAPPLGKAADVCEDYRARGFRYYIGGAMFEGAIYFAYQDMETVCPTPGTLEVTTAWMALVSSGTEGYAQFHAEVWSVDDTDPACPVPNYPLWIGPTLTISVPAGTTGFQIELPLATSPYNKMCVDGPYFIAVVGGAQDAGVEIGPWGSDYGPPPQWCVWYWQNVVSGDPTDWTEYWYDPTYDDSMDLNLSSYANTNEQNNCHKPGICSWEWHHCVWNTYTYYYIAIPAPNGLREEIYSVFRAASPCTIRQVNWYSSTAYPIAGDPGISISIMLDTDSDDIPDLTVAYEEKATATVMPGWNSFTFPADYPVIVPVGNYYVKLGRASWAGVGDTAAGTVDNHDDPDLCYNDCLTFLIANDGSVMSACDYWGVSMELFVEVYKCCLGGPPICGPNPAPDVWLTHAHDYARTSHSSIPVREPCDINLAWSALTTKADASFNNATSDGVSVFCSDNQAVHSYDLVTGALNWTYFDPAGIATAGSIRNNITIAGDYVYGSGGTAMSFFKLNKANGAVIWSRHFNSMGGGVGDMLCGSQRFSVSVEIGDMVIVGDEGGCLWAFDVATGLNHGAWATNPVPLNGTIFHSPAYDGGDYIYVADLSGSIYKIAVADGSIIWTFTETDGDGFYGGCSYDAMQDVIYAASHHGTGGGDTPERFKIAADGSVVWSYSQGATLYSPPTIGIQKVYFAQDYPAQGILVVDKETGLAEYNFSFSGVGYVTNPVALTSSCHLFAGDRQGGWHLLHTYTYERIWTRRYSDFVWGTELVTSAINAKDYAIVTTWSDGPNSGWSRGGVFVWELNSEPRPMVEQLETTVDIPVPFGTGTGTPAAAGDLFRNTAGCAALNVTAINVYDHYPPLLSDVKGRVTQGNPKTAVRAAKVADELAGDDYLSLFSDKQTLMTGKKTDIESFGRHANKRRFEQSKQRTSALAAGAATIRTSNVALDTPSPIAGGTSFGITWVYDGSGLARSVSADRLEFVTDDPDFIPELPGTGYPEIIINYVGGCLYEWFEHMYWNGFEFWHKEQVSNFNRYGVGDPAGHPVKGMPAGYGLDWGDGHHEGPIYDAAFFIAQVGADYAMTTMYDQSDMVNRLLPNPAPISGACGIDYADYVPLGRSVVVDWYDGGNCPPVLGVDYVDVQGEVTWIQTIDTLTNFDPPYTLGTEITQVEICMYDFGSGYGDFKLIHYKIRERNGTPVNDLVAGIFCDWDVEPDYTSNAVAVEANAGGYAVWDSVNPVTAFGHMVLGSGLSATNSSEIMPADYRAVVGIANGYSIYTTTCIQCCTDYDLQWMDCIDNYWFGAFYEPDPGNHGDRSGLIAFPEFNLAAGGDQHLYCAIFGVDASTNDRADVLNNIADMAFRANKWAGFNRGDVNDDDMVNAIDVAYLHAVVQGSLPLIFPWQGNGDVDLNGFVDPADVTYLLNYLMGGPAPLGEWRFDFMP